jgi:anti-sigma factor RsiW
MSHWTHKLWGWKRRLAAYSAGELSPAEQSRLESALATCPECRREVEAYRLISSALRQSLEVSLTPEEAAAFLPEVNRRIDHGRARPTRPTRPGLREILWDHPRLSLASAFTGALLILGLTLSQLPMWVTSGANGVEVVSVDVDEGASVMVFQAPGSALKVIWVFGDSST